MAGRDRRSHGWLELDRNARLGRAAEGLECARLADGVLAPEQQWRVATDRVAHVLQLELVGVRRFDGICSTSIVSGSGSRRSSIAGEWMCQGSSTNTLAFVANHLELVAIREDEAAVEVGHDLAREAQGRGEADVDPARSDDLLGEDALGLSREETAALTQ